MKKLKNKNCLITGAASGIGRSLAIGLAKEGMNLFIVDIKMDNLEEVKKEIEPFGVKVFTGKCDVSKYEDFKNLAKEVYSKLGDIDLLINNAGIGGGSYVEDLELEDWKQNLDINLWSIIYSITVFLPRMLERGSGHIVNTSSGAGVIGLPNHLHYNAAKFAVVGISEGLYSELADRGIDVSVICPTRIKTNIISESTLILPPDLIKGESQQEINKKLDKFKELFSKEHMKNSLTPDQAAKKYIKGIKKRKLFIYDKRIIPIVLFVKAISQSLYKRILRKQGKKFRDLIEQVLSEVELKS